MPFTLLPISSQSEKHHLNDKQFLPVEALGTLLKYSSLFTAITQRRRRHVKNENMLTIIADLFIVLQQLREISLVHWSRAIWSMTV